MSVLLIPCMVQVLPGQGCFCAAAWGTQPPHSRSSIPRPCSVHIPCAWVWTLKG